MYLRLLFITLFFAPSAGVLFAQGPVSLSITADAKKSESGEIEIHFTLRNISKKPLSIFTTLLPWEFHSSTILIFRTSEGDLHEADRVSFGSLTPGEITVNPGESIEGKTNLNEMFPDLLKFLNKGSGLLFWSYHFNADFEKNAGVPELYGGALRIYGAKKNR